MGFFSKILSVAAPIVGSAFGGPVGGAIGSLVGGAIAGKASGGGGTQSATQTTQQQLDPRAQNIIYGDGTAANQGLLNQYQGYLNQPQNAQNAAFGGAAQQFLGGQGGGILSQLQAGSSNLLNSNYAAPSAAGGMASAASSSAAEIGAPGQMQAARVNAPGQNNLNLSSAYSNFINGDAGANPYLTSALQAGVDMTNAGFQKNAGYAKDALDSSLAGIRGNSVLAGQYGSSRQGVAEGNALKSFSDQLNNSNLQLGLANSANTTSAQAQAFNQGQDRSLSALQNLSSQQYGTASQNAAFGQAASAQNQNVNLNAAQFNAGQQQNSNQFNAGLQQQTGQFNAGQSQQNNQFNAGLQGQANALNSQNQQAGLAGMSGLLSNAYGYAQNQDNYGINRASQVNGLLSPYLGMGGTTTGTSSQQMPNNTGANILGGATAGLGLFNGIKNSGLLGSWGSGASNIEPNTWMPSAQNITPY